MPINDPEAIRFVNEVIRPTAEKFRALKAELDSGLARWYGTVSANVTNDAEAVEDGRDAEGVSRLTGADVHSLVTVMAAVRTEFDAAGVADVIEKPTVRPLEAS